MWGREAYRIWAPDEADWSLWAKPTPFAQPSPSAPGDAPPVGGEQFSREPGSSRLSFNALDPETALVIDLPGVESVAVGLEAAALGWRPVPVFNATNGPKPEVPQAELLYRLQAATALLAELDLSPDAPPAFLLDARRRGSGSRPAPGTFDNRWMVFPQDFPSANRLLANEVRRAVVVTSPGAALAEDLRHVLRRWQEAGLPILTAEIGSQRPSEPVDVPRPPRFRNFFYVALAMLGLYRNSAGGFGGIVPTPGSG